MDKLQFHAIGKRSIRKDGHSKVTGQEIFTTDLSLPRMFHGRILRSPFPHATVRSIDTRAAEAMGAFCITFKDVPKITYAERIVTIPQKTFKDRHVLTDRPRHVGEAIAAVAAETDDLAEKALNSIRVEYERLPAVFDAIEAMRPEGVPLHETILFGQEEIEVRNNIAVTREIVEGDIEKGFQESEFASRRFLLPLNVFSRR